MPMKRILFFATALALIGLATGCISGRRGPSARKPNAPTLEGIYVVGTSNYVGNPNFFFRFLPLEKAVAGDRIEITKGEAEKTFVATRIHDSTKQESRTLVWKEKTADHRFLLEIPQAKIPPRANPRAKYTVSACKNRDGDLTILFNSREWGFTLLVPYVDNGNSWVFLQSPESAARPPAPRPSPKKQKHFRR